MPPGRERQVPLRPTDAPIRLAAISNPVARRIRRGVNQEKPLLASQARMPVVAATAVLAPIMHWTHTGRF